MILFPSEWHIPFTITFFTYSSPGSTRNSDIHFSDLAGTVLATVSHLGFVVTFTM